MRPNGSMKRTTRSWLLAVALSTLLVGCVKHLPPAATPEAVAPAVVIDGLPATGHGRLVLDVLDGPTPIQRVRVGSERIDSGEGREHWSLYEAPELLCESPCVAEVPLGNVMLGFPVAGDSQQTEVELVHVSDEPGVYRRVLSRREVDDETAYMLGIISAVFGGMSMGVGAVFLPVGLGESDDGLVTAGAITLGIGGALVAAGIIGILVGRPVVRPGSSVRFALSD